MILGNYSVFGKLGGPSLYHINVIAAHLFSDIVSEAVVADRPNRKSRMRI